MTHHRQILSAYALLEPAQKALVDGLVAQLEPAAVKRRVPLLDLLQETLQHSFASFSEREQIALSDRLVLSALYTRAQDIDDRMRLAEHTIMKVDQIIIAAKLDDYINLSDTGDALFKWSEVTPDQMLAIESVKIKERIDGTIEYEIKLHNKHASLERQSKIMQMQKNDSTFWENYKHAEHKSAQPMRAIGDDQTAQHNAYEKVLERIRARTQ